MIVVCKNCGLEYDDVYRLTICPHENFEMRCIVHAGKFSKLCTTPEEVNEFLKAHGENLA